MALSKVTAGQVEPASIPAESSKVVANGAKADTPRKAGHQDFKARGESIGAKMSEEEKAREGVKRGAIAFVCALGNPKQRQDRVAAGKNVVCWKPVGYKFKALEDITVPVIPLKENYQTLIDVAIENATEVPVKAGEEFVCNLREYGALISRTEYNGIFNGEGKEVYLGVTFSGSRQDPYPILKAKDGSIKANMELVADEEDITGADGSTIKKYTVKPEYAEKFGVLFKARSASRTGRGTAKTSEQGVAASCIARALADYYAKH